jgi:hypothetical protein
MVNAQLYTANFNIGSNIGISNFILTAEGYLEDHATGFLAYVEDGATPVKFTSSDNIATNGYNKLVCTVAPDTNLLSCSASTSGGSVTVLKTCEIGPQPYFLALVTPDYSPQSPTACSSTTFMVVGVS